MPRVPREPVGEAGGRAVFPQTGRDRSLPRLAAFAAEARAYLDGLRIQAARDDPNQYQAPRLSGRHQRRR
jgi:hypothetical protein